MKNEIALIKSRTFWAALLALVAVAASQFKLNMLYAWASDPKTIDTVLNGVAMISMLIAMATRAAATSKVTSVLPPADDGKLRSAPLATLAAAALAAAPGCNDEVKQALARIHANVRTAEQFLSSTVPVACDLIHVAESDGEIVLNAGIVSAGDVAHVRQVEGALDALCLNPTQQNSGAILSRLWAGYSQIHAIFKKTPAR